MIEHRIPFPFHRVVDFSHQLDLVTSWLPGAFRPTDFDHDDVWSANGMGFAVYTEISRHTPPGYRERVFYTRHWIDPDGGVFGNKQLRMCGIVAFNSLLRGYRYPVEIGDNDHVTVISYKKGVAKRVADRMLEEDPLDLPF